MDLSEISQYPHKIYKINVTNDNKVENSFYNTVTIKITMPKNPKEIIRFSKERNSDWIEHKSSGDDYFLLIDNTEGITTIYAHFFMNDLYSYEESDMDVVYEYDLKELYNDIIKNDTDVHHSEHQYDTQLTDDNKLRIQSRLYNSINNTNDPHYDNHKNPNYKNYTSIINANNKNDPTNQTEKGYFPISSRYRRNIPQDILDAPYINGTPSPSWRTHNHYETFPYWEVHIKKDKFGSIIKEDKGEDTFPLNVHLNYHYLDTSAEHHQHLYGFESSFNTAPKEFNVFDISGLNKINKNFAAHDYTIINNGNRQDGQYYIDYNHTNIIDLDLHNTDNTSCEWKKNICYNYWIYKSKAKDNYANLTIGLEKGKEYTLKYYVWIPSEVKKTDNDCYIDIRYLQNEQDKIYKGINNNFKEQDNILRNEWIYHEFSFVAQSAVNTIHIKGPQTPNKTIYFMDITLEQQDEHSPTLKYTQNNLFLIEGTKATKKPTSEYNNNNISNVIGSAAPWKPTKKFYTPYNNIKIQVGDETNIIYDKDTTTLSWYNGTNSKFHIKNFNKYTDTALEWVNDREKGNYMEYDEKTTKLTLHRNIEKILTYGMNNYIDLTFTDNNNNPIRAGEVSCAISLYKTYEESVNGGAQDITKERKFLGTKKVNHIVNFNKIDLSKLDKSKTYYLRIDYKHPCHEEIIREYKLLYIEEENISMQLDIVPEEGASVQNIPKGGKYTVNVREEFPLRINSLVYVKQNNNKKTNGYCEMYINDEKFSTTFVDDTGCADFYLNYKDIEEESVIKIEFFDDKEDATIYSYFTIETKSGYDKPVVPIRIKHLINDINKQNQNSIEIPLYGCLLLDIDTGESVDFSIKIYKNNTEIYFNNIMNKQDKSIVIGDSNCEPLSRDETYTYKIITDNMKGNDKETDINDTYRKYEKTFNVTYKHQNEN